MTRSSWISDLRWVRPAQQSRSRRTVERLLDAADAVIGEKGFHDTAVADIATRAGCSVGALYHHFRDKNALLHALLARTSDEFRATIDLAVDPERWEGASISEILEAYLQFTIEEGRRHSGSRQVMRALALRDPVVHEFFELQHVLDQRLSQLMRDRADEIDHRDVELAIAFVLEQLKSMLLMRLEGAGVGTPLESRSDACFVREIIASVCAYMQILPPSTPEYLP